MQRQNTQNIYSAIFAASDDVGNDTGTMVINRRQQSGRVEFTIATSHEEQNPPILFSLSLSPFIFFYLTCQSCSDNGGRHSFPVFFLSFFSL